MGLRDIDILATLLLNLIQYGCSDHILSCNSSLLEQCTGANEVCDAKSHSPQSCKCSKGFVRVGDACVVPGDASTAHGGATVAVVTILTLVLLIAGAILVVRKYNLVDYIRQKISRRNNDVMYEDVMIGNDDPPLSP